MSLIVVIIEAVFVVLFLGSAKIIDKQLREQSKDLVAKIPPKYLKNTLSVTHRTYSE
ncbi:MAG: hypothetical protein IH840_14660 [Candidatus Heimdallarchaeota archaeon]|nr:hypothetical protein [Candidatus Heimdallarchaeota archaeon]